MCIGSLSSWMRKGISMCRMRESWRRNSRWEGQAITITAAQWKRNKNLTKKKIVRRFDNHPQQHTLYSHIFLCARIRACVCVCTFFCNAETQAVFAVSHVMRLIFDRIVYAALLRIVCARTKYIYVYKKYNTRYSPAVHSLVYSWLSDMVVFFIGPGLAWPGMAWHGTMLVRIQRRWNFGAKIFRLPWYVLCAMHFGVAHIYFYIHGSRERQQEEQNIAGCYL